MWQMVAGNLRACWRPLILADLVFKLLAVSVLLPLISLLYRLFLGASGRTVLADMEIVRFLAHPLGWITLIVVGGMVVAAYALRQAVLMTICVRSQMRLTVTPLTGARFIVSRTPDLLRLTSRVVAQLVLLALPFLLVGGGLYLWLLTDHDINFYLVNKPPKFFIASSLIGFVLVAMLAVLTWRIVTWAFAMQILLYESRSPRASLRHSGKRSIGDRKALVGGLCIWAACHAMLGMAATFLVFHASRFTLSLASSSWVGLVFAAGMLALLAMVVNYALTFAANASLASWLGMTFLRFANEDPPSLPALRRLNQPDAPVRLPLRWLSGQWLSGRRLIIGSAAAVIVATSLSATALRDISFEDRVQITAHRGGGGSRPENTLVAIGHAIEVQADWVEIDVQESSDGVVVVVHDSDFKRIAGNPTKVWEATAAELGQIDIGSCFDPRYADQRVPTLEQVLQACKGKVGLNIELKYYGHDQQLEQRVVDLVKQYEMESDVVAMSLEARGIRRLKAIAPDWPTGLLTAVKAGDVTRTDADFLAVNRSIATRTFVQAAHLREKPVAVWTVNDAQTISKMISLGVDNVITDYPERARQVLATRAALSPAERLLLEVAYFFGISPPAEKLLEG